MSKKYIVYSNRLWSVFNLDTGDNTSWVRNISEAIGYAKVDDYYFDHGYDSEHKIRAEWGETKDFYMYECEDLETIEEVYPELFI